MNKKNKVLLLIVSVFLITLISLGTYALWNEHILTDNNNITSGQIKMSYTETNEINMNNAVPMTDNDGKLLTDYFDFQVLTYIKTKANDDTKRTINYNIVLEPLVTDNSLKNDEIKVYLTKIENGTETVVVEPITIDKLNQYVLKSQKETFSNNKVEVITSYRLRAWIDKNVDTSKINKEKYSYKFRININNEVESVKKDYALEFAQDNVGKNGLEKITHEIDDTLQVDNKFKTEYRYRGGNVTNYVTFNNEVWRILGVIPTEDANGNIENRFKIIKDSSLGNEKWNEIEDKVTNSYNNWTAATLNTYLNEEYYNSLTNEAKQMIGTTKYYLGGYNDTNITLDIMWQYERKNENNKKSYYYGTNPIMQNDANKKIAIMYASDYGYGASKECTNSLFSYDGSSNCKAPNNWLDKSVQQWLLSQNAGSSSFVFYVYSSGFISSGSYANTSSSAVYPVLSLIPNVKISDGNGTSSNPYQLSVE